MTRLLKHSISLKFGFNKIGVLNIFLLLLVAADATCGNDTYPVLSELPKPSQDSILRGDATVTVTLSAPGWIWPEVRIYRKVAAPTALVEALFLDYEHARTFIPNIEAATVINSPSKDIKDVLYKIKLPVIFSVEYVVRNTHQTTPAADGGNCETSKVSWTMLKPPFAAKSAEGSLRAVQCPGCPDSSVICYSNHVEPATKLIAALKGTAIKEAQKTVEAISREAESRYRVQKSATPNIQGCR